MRTGSSSCQKDRLLRPRIWSFDVRLISRWRKARATAEYRKKYDCSFLRDASCLMRILFSPFGFFRRCTFDEILEDSRVRLSEWFSQAARSPMKQGPTFFVIGWSVYFKSPWFFFQALYCTSVFYTFFINQLVAYHITKYCRVSRTHLLVHWKICVLFSHGSCRAKKRRKTKPLAVYYCVHTASNERALYMLHFIHCKANTLRTTQDF